MERAGYNKAIVGEWALTFWPGRVDITVSVLLRFRMLAQYMSDHLAGMLLGASVTERMTQSPAFPQLTLKPNHFIARTASTEQAFQLDLRSHLVLDCYLLGSGSGHMDKHLRSLPWPIARLIRAARTARDAAVYGTTNFRALGDWLPLNFTAGRATASAN